MMSYPEFFPEDAELEQRCVAADIRVRTALTDLLATLRPKEKRMISVPLDRHLYTGPEAVYYGATRAEAFEPFLPISLEGFGFRILWPPAVVVLAVRNSKAPLGRHEGND